jgi:hypothetical protein
VWAGRASTCTKHKQYDDIERKELKVQKKKNDDAWRRLKRLEKRGGSLKPEDMPKGIRPDWLDEQEDDESD